MVKPYKEEAAWYESWFDSPYYPLLYQRRDEVEARAFIDHLLEVWHPQPGARLLDLACGRGRYSRYLADKGYDVTGLDLSVASIGHARAYEHEQLAFYTHDMRRPFRANYFDGIFSFFTSFGYFDNRADDLRTLRSAALGLKPGGVFVLDFFNAAYVAAHLGEAEEKTVDGVFFRTEKWVEGDHVNKSIAIFDGGRELQFTERVALLGPADFEGLFAQAGLGFRAVFGDYQLGPFEPQASPRYIIMAERI
jgi:SAM-dependent methyltransferase